MLDLKINEELELLKKDYRFRELKTNKEYLINFSSNDYLDIASDKSIVEDFFKKFNFNDFRLSSTSSRLIDGSYNAVMNLEQRVEEIFLKPCLVFNSGFDANSSLIETFFDKNSLIITDRLNHASIYDGMLNSQAKILRYKHLDYSNLESLLRKYSDHKDILVVTETIYSMDGDVANLDKIIALKKKYNFKLMVDEAHSYGVHSYGIAHSKNLIQDIDFLVIPLGKGGASVGAYVICDKIYKEFLINKSRKFIYSTALPPINNFWNLYVLNNMLNFRYKMEKLENLKEFSLNLLSELKINTFSESHIISIILGENKRTTRIAKKLCDKGFIVNAIREPTVPKNTARLRVSLTADMDKNLIERFFLELNQEIKKCEA